MSIAAIITQGYLPASDASLPQVVLMGYGGEAEPPPVPPPADDTPPRHGPALTPGERRKWFGGKRDEEFESPQQREIRRQSIERLKRIEIGLLPPDPVEAQAEIEARVDEQLAKPEVKARSFGKPIDTKAVVDKVTARVAAEMKAEKERRVAEEKELEEERREAEYILSVIRFLSQ